MEENRPRKQPGDDGPAGPVKAAAKPARKQARMTWGKRARTAGADGKAPPQMPGEPEDKAAAPEETAVEPGAPRWGSPPPRHEPVTGSPREREAARIFTLAANSHRHGQLADAVRGYTEALAINPLLTNAYTNLGVALRGLGKLEAAVACYRRSLALKPANAGVYSNLGNALREMGRYQLAVAVHQQAVTLAPDSPEAIYNLGLVLRDLGHLVPALACLDKALSIRGDYIDCHWDRALTLLQMGDLEAGFREYEWRWKLPESPPRGYDKPRWDGSDLEGRTILVHQEQGFGDMIQFVRYVPLVEERGARVVVQCQPELARLFATVPGIENVVSVGAPLPDFDVYAPMLSLPMILGTTLSTIPAKVPYLAAGEARGPNLPVPLGCRLKVGIGWAGKATHKNDTMRSCGLARFVEIMGIAGIAFFSLQKGEPAAELTEVANKALVTDLGQSLNDFADTAAVISQLDLLISVDTALVHLAGALGKPVWVIQPFSRDWRWLEGRDDSPWYPTLRMFRQEKPGDWDGVFVKVRKALRDLVGAEAAPDGK